MNAAPARYPGSKSGAGVFQTIVSLMPKHQRYFEPFLGTGAILRRKAPALKSIVGDKDPAVMRWHRANRLPDVEYFVADYWELLQRSSLGTGDLVYLDPPYHHSTRSRKDYYRFELDDDDHARLLARVKSLPGSVDVMLSGYRCPLYDRMLERWHRTDFQAMTAGGKLKTESVWTNFAPGVSFHDTSFAGANFRERWRIKKKVRRWLGRIKQLQPIERAALVRSLLSATPEES